MRMFGIIIKVVTLLVVALQVAFANSIRQESANGKVVLCYFGSWSVYRYGEGKFDVEDIDPYVCTHLV